MILENHHTLISFTWQTSFSCKKFTITRGCSLHNIFLQMEASTCAEGPAEIRNTMFGTPRPPNSEHHVRNTTSPAAVTKFETPRSEHHVRNTRVALLQEMETYQKENEKRKILRLETGKKRSRTPAIQRTGEPSRYVCLVQVSSININYYEKIIHHSSNSEAVCECFALHQFHHY